MLVAAAIIAFAAGGNGVFGGFGGLFGSAGQSALDVARGSDPVNASAIVASPTAAQRLAASLHGTSTHPGTRAHRHAASRRGARPRTGPHRGSTGLPQPTLPRTPPAPPPPQKGQTVKTGADTITQVTNQAPPQVHPVTDPVNGAVGTVVQTCTGLPACP